MEAPKKSIAQAFRGALHWYETAETPEETPALIDPAAHQRLVEWGGPKLLRQMLRLYLENSGERMSQIATGFEEGSVQLVERGSHSLKSSAANIGATRVTSLAQDMEDRAAEGDMEGARTLHAELQKAQGEAENILLDIERGLSE